MDAQLEDCAKTALHIFHAFHVYPQIVFTFGKAILVLYSRPGAKKHFDKAPFYLNYAKRRLATYFTCIWFQHFWRRSFSGSLVYQKLIRARLFWQKWSAKCCQHKFILLRNWRYPQLVPLVIYLFPVHLFKLCISVFYRWIGWAVDILTKVNFMHVRRVCVNKLCSAHP